MRRHAMPAIVLVLLLAGMAPAQNTNAAFSTALAQGNAALQAGQAITALNAFQRAQKLKSPCIRCRWGMAQAWYQLRHYGETIHCCKWLEKHASQPEMQFQSGNLRGVSLFGKGKYKDAAKAFERLTALRPRDANLYFNLGVAWMKADKDARGIAALQKMLGCSPSAKLAALAHAYIADPRRARDQFAPDVTLTDAGGHTFPLASLAGKVVLLDFWATWCGPCHESLPAIRGLAHDFRKKPFVVISIAEDSPIADWRKQIQSGEMPWTQVYDTNALGETFRVHAFPTFILLDGDQIVRGRSDGWGDVMRIVLAQAIEKTLKQTRKELKREAKEHAALPGQRS